MRTALFGWACFVLLTTTTFAQDKLDHPILTLLLDDFKQAYRIQNKIPVNDIPIRIEGGLMLMRASLNGKAGIYILDTGASHLFLNRKVKPGEGIHALGISGNAKIMETEVEHFQIGQIEYEHQPAYQMDLSHLEELKKCQIDGIIGINLLSKFELFVDYDHGEIKLVSAGSSSIYDQRQPLRITGLRFDGHFPVIQLAVAGRTYNFALDTGAETNIFASKYEQKIKRSIKSYSNIRVRGLTNQSMDARFFTLKNMKVMGLNYSAVDFIFSDLSAINENYNVDLDGILGYPFLNSFPFSIDFENGQFTLWQNFSDEVYAPVTLAK